MALTKLSSADNVGLDLRSSFDVDPLATLTAEQTIDFEENHGYYRNIPELQAVIDRLALWVVYGGDDEKDPEIKFKSKAQEDRFRSFNGFGKDTPEDILYNLFRMGKICGCSVAEIITSKNKKGIINLKPLDPETIKVKANEKGILYEFEQINTKAGADGKHNLETQTYKLNDIFYIAWNRIADEIVGISTIEKLKTIIDYRHQAMEDLAEVFHRYVVPFWLFYVDEDDPTEIDDFKAKVKTMIENKDHMVLPKDVVEKSERLAVPQFATLDPLNWIKHLERYFLLCEGVPEIIAGIGRETADASSRMIYLAWRIITIANQKIYEKHIKAQLGLDLKLPRPINILAPEISMQKTKVLSARDKNNKDNNKDNSNNK